MAGRLFDLGGYPGWIPGRGTVAGQLFAVADPDILPVLDAFEGYHPGNPAGSLYIREVVRTAGRAAGAFIYRYNWAWDEGMAIPSGDWTARRRAHSAAAGRDCR